MGTLGRRLTDFRARIGKIAAIAIKPRSDNSRHSLYATQTLRKRSTAVAFALGAIR